MTEQRSLLPSPCIKVCAYDPDTGMCMGCFRTPEEIAVWKQRETGAQTRIMQMLAVRQVQYAHHPAFSEATGNATIREFQHRHPAD